MATQALVSSSSSPTSSVEAARQTFIGRLPQSSSRKVSFVVEAALPWFQTGVIPPSGTYSYWADPFTLFVLEMALMGFALLQSTEDFQDWYNPRSMGKQYVLGLEKGISGSGNPAYPGGPYFNPLGFGKDKKSMKDLKLKEIKNGRLAMLAVLGYFIQG